MNTNSANRSCVYCGGKTAIYGHGSAGRRLKLRCLDCGERFTLAKPAYRQPRSAGSGIVAPPCRGREWKPLKRDPMAHMALAMLTRR